MKDTEESVQVLSEATTHSERFNCTSGGEHTCTDDIFKAAEMKNRKQKVSALQKDK